MGLKLDSLVSCNARRHPNIEHQNMCKYTFFYRSCMFLGLLCVTVQQSYCLHAGVPSSVHL